VFAVNYGYRRINDRNVHHDITVCRNYSVSYEMKKIILKSFEIKLIKSLFATEGPTETVGSSQNTEKYKDINRHTKPINTGT